MECAEHSHPLAHSWTSVRHTPPEMRLPVIEWVGEAELERYRLMSLLLITPQTTQLACFHRDNDTLGMHSNVAGTRKTRAKWKPLLKLS
jgi:hypothetical protein